MSKKSIFSKNSIASIINEVTDIINSENSEVLNYIKGDPIKIANVLLEKHIEGREIECSVLGNDKPIASIPGEIVVFDEFYSYDTKYINDTGAVAEIPAKISKKEMNNIQKLAIKTFNVLSCEGFGRVDFFLKKNGAVFVNEINTIPGFTSISMYPKMWEKSGLPLPKLLDRLIELAIERFIREQKLQTTIK